MISVHVQLYTTCIELAANKKHTENLNFCMTFVLCIMPYITNITVQHKGCILPIPTDFNLLTNYSPMIIILLQAERNVFINDSNYVTKYISL